MADNFLSEIKPLQNSIHEETRETDVCSEVDLPELQDEIANEDITSFEKYIINHKLNLEKRLKKLQSTMTFLKKQLAEEKSMWKAQLEEILQESVSCEHKSSDNFESDNIFDSISNSTEIIEDAELNSRNCPITDLDVKLFKFQDPLIKLQAEKRANLRRQMSINNYKRRLLEVENMCNLELLRVKQNVQFLQPLQMIASEWNLNSAKENAVAEDEISETQPSESSLKDNCDNPKLDDTLLGNQFCNDVNAVFARMQYCTLKVPQAKSSPSSSEWRLDDDILGVERGNSGVWHSSEYLTSAVPTSINLF
ncbi:hypothetical protein ILUMI_26355 [Ignelater luminosus]|uniref:Uncharacterized protein n=1 Tax=Ignelater luminosus TaxID=2038154 RepID=A0A8K0C860_IGNLU|nr:hypothetical protein ILUMI_26355 [Ignelater luminosus]